MSSGGSFDIDAELARIEAGLSDDLGKLSKRQQTPPAVGKTFSATVAENISGSRIGDNTEKEEDVKSWFEQRAATLLKEQAESQAVNRPEAVRVGNGMTSFGDKPAVEADKIVSPLPPPPGPTSPVNASTVKLSAPISNVSSGESPAPLTLTAASLKAAENSAKPADNSIVAMRSGLQIPPKNSETKSQGTAVSSVAAMKKALDDRMKKVRKRLPEPCSCGDTKADMQDKDRPLMRGEVEFNGLGAHRAHYIIVHKDQEAADEVLKWMFTTEGGWKLKLPNLILFGYGGRDHYVNWSSSETLRNRKAWGFDDGRRPSKEQVPKIPTSKGGMEKTDKKAKPGKLESPDQLNPLLAAGNQAPKMTEAKFHAKFRGRLCEIAGGVCQAVLECGGWFDFGHGMRGGMGEVLKDGLKVYWSAFGALAGHKEDGVVLAIRELEDTEFSEQFEACAVPTTPLDNIGTLEPLTKRVMYPSVDAALFPEITENYGDAQTDIDDDDLDDMMASAQKGGSKNPSKKKGFDEGSHVSSVKLANEVKHKITARFLLNCLTHIVFVQNLQIKDRLRYMLRDLATRAVIVANGNPALIQPGVEGKILAEAISGVPVIILHNTGGAAEMLGNAVNKRRQHVDPYDHYVDDGGTMEQEYGLPENIPDDHILILQPAKDSVEKVINKLTLVLSTVSDKEMMEVGYQKGERNRLRYAWELFTLFRYNAAIQRRRARILFYIMMVISVLITLIATIYTSTQDGHLVHDVEWDDGFITHFKKGGWKGSLKVVLLLLPVVNGFLMTMISRFNPIGKWAHLESGAVNLQSEIYQYRCRVIGYMPRKGANMGIEEKVESLLSCDPIDGIDGNRTVQRRKKKKQGPTAELSRRGQFAIEVERINSETIGSELRGDSLVKPSVNALNETLATLYDSKAVATKHQSSSRTCCQKICCRGLDDMDDDLDIDDFGDRMAEDNKREWKKAFSDFRVNPYIIDDDFLRDDGFSLITAEDYIHFRLLPLTQRYNATAQRLSRQVHAIQGIAFFLTALLTASAAVGFEKLAPIVVSLIAAVQAIDELEHLQARLRNINQSLESLKNLHVWWQSLSMVERRLLANKEILVGGVEATVDAEISTWKKSSLKVGKGKSGGGDDEDGDDDEKA